MSAVKIISSKSFFLTFLLLIFLSCDYKKGDTQNTDEEKIEVMTLSHIGGENGFYEIIKIKKDSIFFDSGTSKPSKNNNWKNALSKDDWQLLSSSIKIKNLDSIRSSPSIQHLDGIDETLIIKTSKKSHIFVNSYNDIHYNQIEILKNRLNNIISKKQLSTVKKSQK
ncbi:hypothetical protein [Chryseobacterium sp. RR2-3-20]|uniref:hypothetical protein n=1 Tax=Chryseobacterium sp. RR2-3-20 TaxID=2787626 RepID=UPI001AE00E97|nr:hypothetical protein [Chryseobacterium sp. RR2-3-20]